MKTIITLPEKDPLGAMMLDYLAGSTSAYVQVDSPPLEMWQRGQISCSGCICFP
ncbi:MAG: hypothetical protein KKE62_05090 [Proteobacteria bacterium]|nr:hypothetical protein [Pseudomonadota bacterium]MBU1388139.1 hypothetical protein [Pseudomonadota bacterium]MBU1542203.1 hypothetical protein [Pseudomonadota bacterium]MBU2481641.1 hypothetical protein [Pseudomonadota bacterium]